MVFDGTVKECGVLEWGYDRQFSLVENPGTYLSYFLTRIIACLVDVVSFV